MKIIGFFIVKTGMYGVLSEKRRRKWRVEFELSLSLLHYIMNINITYYFCVFFPSKNSVHP